MNYAHSLIIGASIVLSSLIFSLYNLPFGGQYSGNRYQVTAVPHESVASRVYITDTYTGETWSRSDSNQGGWRPLGTPVSH
jgi:hypothetical protein